MLPPCAVNRKLTHVMREISVYDTTSIYNAEDTFLPHFKYFLLMVAELLLT